MLLDVIRADSYLFWFSSSYYVLCRSFYWFVTSNASVAWGPDECNLFIQLFQAFKSRKYSENMSDKDSKALGESVHISHIDWSWMALMYLNACQIAYNSAV
ncbi:hypothetical protein JTB14_035440 [Gonioctena quinquepunctata]|nr:hypothetical protein JTB14_035440 [Gonioctena quinquepunctata]